MKKVAITLVFLVLSQISFSQIKKFGKVSKEELQAKSCETFKGAGAVVLFKKQDTHYEYDGSTGWSVITTIHERIKIYNNDFFNVATKEIPFYSPINAADESVGIKATTYNLVAGKVAMTKLNKSEIFTTKVNKFWSEKKFTMPNITDGSIIEWKYTITSPYIYHIDDFVFQNDIPSKYFRGEISLPEEMAANYKVNGNFDLKISKDNGLIMEIKDIEPLLKEPFVNNV